MLHELTHIVVGPHNQKFYSLLDELWGEAEKLMDKGISGSGVFDGEGARVGGKRLTTAESRAAQQRAAEKRQKMGALMGSGVLGGSRSSLSIGELAARAAERRAHDDLWCPGEGQREVDYIEDLAEVENHPSQCPCCSNHHSSKKTSSGSSRACPQKVIEEEHNDGVQVHSAGAGAHRAGAGAHRAGERACSQERSKYSISSKKSADTRVGSYCRASNSDVEVIDLISDDDEGSSANPLQPAPAKQRTGNRRAWREKASSIDPATSFLAPCPRCKEPNELSLKAQSELPLCNSCGAAL